LPDPGVEAAELLLDGEERPGVGDGSGDLEPVADDSGVGEQQRGLFGAIAGDGRGVELSEGRAIPLALFEDGLPTETCLGAFEDEQLEESAVVMDRYAPLLVVVADQRLPGSPLTALTHRALSPR
jgi:hypothetical protein